ncbi:hypothetical protein [Nocardiopsis coralliicola]
MRFTPSALSLRTVRFAGVLAAAGVLTAGCSEMPDMPFGDDLGDMELPDLSEVLPSASPDAEEGESAALPASCTEIGAEGLASGLVPAGAALNEDASAPEDGGPDAERLACTWAGSAEGGGAPALSLVFTRNADPAGAVQLVQAPEEEANWEVDVDTYDDTYQSSESDALDGELAYSTTVEGGTQHVTLTLPGDLHVTAVAQNIDTDRDQLEQLAVQAAQQSGAEGGQQDGGQDGGAGQEQGQDGSGQGN